MTKQKAAFLAAFLGLYLLSGCASTEPGPELRTAEFYNHNAQRLYDGAHYEQALHQFDKALAADPSNKVALLGRAWSLVTVAESQILQGDRRGGDNVQDARTSFEELEGEDFGANTYKVNLGLGKVHVLLGDLYEVRATRLREEAKRRPPDDPRHAAIREAERLRADSYRLAESHFLRVLDTSDNKAAQTNLTALIHLARISVIQGEFADAMIYAERYLEQVRRSKDLWVESLRRHPEDKAIWEIKLSRAVNKEVEVRDLIANALYKLGRLEPAEEELRHVILLDPGRGDPYLNRGIIREELGKKADAVRDYRQYLVHAAKLDLSPEDERVIEATKRLLRLEKELGLEPTVTPEEISETGG